MQHALNQVATAHAAPNQPETTLAALAEALANTVGYRLFTILLHDPAATKIRRAYSSNPAEYPIGGAKPITNSPWMHQVLHQGKPYIGSNREDIRTVFFDYELIWSLGCESVLNLPIPWNGNVIAILNLLHQAHWYDAVNPEDLKPIAQLAVPAILAMQGG